MFISVARPKVKKKIYIFVQNLHANIAISNSCYAISQHNHANSIAMPKYPCEMSVET